MQNNDDHQEKKKGKGVGANILDWLRKASLKI